MSERIRNVAVGITVVVALLLLAVMILIFTTLPAAFQGGYPVPMLSDSTHDVEPGLPVHFAGLRVGYVRDIRYTDPHDPTRGVTLTVRIDRAIRLPGNTAAYIYTKGFVGSAYVELKASGPAHTDPRTGKPLAYLPTDGSVALQVVHEGGGLIPDELKSAIEDLRSGFKDLGTLARNLNDLLVPPPPAAAPPEGNAPATASAPAPPAADLRATLAKLGKALDGLAVMAGDPQNQANLKTSLANLAQVSGQAAELMQSLKATLAQAGDTLRKADAAVGTVTTMATKAGGTLDELAPKLMDGMDKLATLLTALNRVAGKLETADGTAGKLLNDPKLYNTLLEIASQLTSLVKEFRVLTETWEKNGVGIKLK